MRLRLRRPRRLSSWLLIALALMLAPQFIGAAVGISAQQREIRESRKAGRAIAARVAAIARLQGKLDATEDAVRSAAGRGDPPVGARVRATLERAEADVRVLADPGTDRDFAQLQAQAAAGFATASSVQRFEQPLDRLRDRIAQQSAGTLDDLATEERRGRSDQAAQLLAILLSFVTTLVPTLLVAWLLIASIRRPLAALRSSARRLGSGDLTHPVELRSFTEFNQVADSLNAMAAGLRQSRNELDHRAFHDALTGLANRALLFDRITHALARSGAAERSPVGVLCVDIDDFKAVNDSLGHSRGDEVIIEVGRRISGVLRPVDTVARLAGDEFAVLFEELAAPAAAVRVAERILLALSSPVVVAGVDVDVSASIGVAISSGQAHGADELIRAGELAMYAAKDAGKRGYRVFEEAMLSGAVERLSLERDLKRAVERNELELHYQPIMNLENGRVRAVEGLARWTHPERGRVVPDVFIPLAEQSGLIVPLGRQLLKRACADLPGLRAGLGEPDLLMGVNLSAAELLEPGLPEDLLRIVADAGITPDCLVLEITESQIMSDLDAGVARLQELNALGVQLALDDFGTGYSSLAYLRSFPVSSLKVDKAFIDNVAQVGSGDHALVRSIISLGTTLELTVIAEGIEHEDQRRELERLGCTRGQGYLFARPMPAADLVAAFSVVSA